MRVTCLNPVQARPSPPGLAAAHYRVRDTYPPSGTSGTCSPPPGTQSSWLLALLGTWPSQPGAGVSCPRQEPPASSRPTVVAASGSGIRRYELPAEAEAQHFFSVSTSFWFAVSRFPLLTSPLRFRGLPHPFLGCSREAELRRAGITYMGATGVRASELVLSAGAEPHLHLISTSPQAGGTYTRARVLGIRPPIPRPSCLALSFPYLYCTYFQASPFTGTPYIH